MTPMQCLEARAQLGWTRHDLAQASGLATPIVRLFEAGALEGFDDCEAVIAEALHAAQAAKFSRLAGEPKAKRERRQGALGWLEAARRRWGLLEDEPVTAYVP